MEPSLKLEIPAEKKQQLPRASPTFGAISVIWNGNATKIKNGISPNKEMGFSIVMVDCVFFSCWPLDAVKKCDVQEAKKHAIRKAWVRQIPYRSGAIAFWVHKVRVMKSYHTMFGVTRGNICNPSKHLAIISHFNIIFQVDLEPDFFSRNF